MKSHLNCCYGLHQDSGGAFTYLDTLSKRMSLFLSMDSWRHYCFALDIDARCFTISTNLNFSGSDCSLLFDVLWTEIMLHLLCNLVSIFTMFCSCIEDCSSRECLEWITHIWERSDCYKLILVDLWFRVVPLSVTSMSSASEFGQDAHIMLNIAFAKVLWYLTCAGHFIQKF